MGIYIPGIEMPTSCTKCPCSDDEVRYCWAANAWIPMLGKPEFCPLVEVPKHGRVVDVSALEVVAYTGTDGRPDTFDAGVEWAAEQIDKLPTVIPKEEP